MPVYYRRSQKAPSWTKGSGGKYVPKNTKKYVNRAINRDKTRKGFVYSVNAVELSTTWTYQDISLVAQGDNYNQREGTNIKPGSLTGSIIVTRDNDAAADSYMRYKIAIIQWRPNSASANPDTFAKIFEDDTAGVTTQSPFTNDPSKRSQFKILWVREGVVGTRETGSEGVPSRRTHRFFIKGKHMNNISFNTATATTGSNKIFRVMYSDNATGSDNGTVAHSSNLVYREA